MSDLSEDMPVMIFVRKEGFYPIIGLKDRPLAEQARDHAEINPGTIRVEDRFGNVLWRLP